MEKTFEEKLNAVYEAEIKPLLEKKDKARLRLAAFSVELLKFKKKKAAQISVREHQLATATAEGNWDQAKTLEADIDALKESENTDEECLNLQCDIDILQAEVADLTRQITNAGTKAFAAVMPQAQEKVFDALEAWLDVADSTWNDLTQFAGRLGIQVRNNRERLIPKDSAMMYGERSKLLYNRTKEWGW